MPKIRTTRTKKPPEGFEEIESVRISYFEASSYADMVLRVTPLLSTTFTFRMFSY
jgi:hypothetical protein